MKKIKYPKVTVIIPVYKVEKYLRGSIHSVLLQDYPNLQIICVDDGSPDNCPRICDELAQQYKNVRVIHKVNGGLSSARNVGLDAIRDNTKYVLFLDSDDQLEEHVIRGMVQKAEDTGAAMVIPDRYRIVYENTGYSRIRLHFPEKFYFTNPRKFAMNVLMEQGRAWRAHSLLYLYPAIIKANARFPEGRISEDISFNLKILASVDRITIFPYSTVKYLKRQESITTTFQPQFERDIAYIDQQARSFLQVTGHNGTNDVEKANALTCRNVILYIIDIMSHKNSMTYKEKIKKAKTLVYSWEKMGGVLRAYHVIPWFDDPKKRIALYFLYVLFRNHRENIAYKILSKL